MEFTHFNEEGRARMVDVSDKDITARVAEARGTIVMKPDTIDLIRSMKIEKGDVLAVAQVAGIMAAKRTSDLIPMCHPVMTTGIDIDFTVQENSIDVRARVKTVERTGVEMEALTAVSVACLTIYDMCKAVDRGMRIGDIRLTYKSGGKSGEYRGE
ncbi:cyclic pyranopterin monophosphate synthase MoaC [Calorimonas adulescens]|uniref:Cyclic pyranopterin monophosphate synthase n=1 Tax=Calorimonas adulescens TaxID=2606906 RepID=A0A5D8QCY9_9THEO|nr:cyclic pyranopterin monophosphate synthase MoaC [Calorimonas adulescens]TZE82510.1 cyclic pyranopterin monophosphate synthase MoaC [Calorimonas adulescens]